MLQKMLVLRNDILSKFFYSKMILSLIFFEDTRNMGKGNQKINVAQGIALRRAFKTVVTFAGCFRRKFMFLLVVYSLGRSLLEKIFERFASLKSLKSAIMDKGSCWSVVPSAFAETVEAGILSGEFQK